MKPLIISLFFFTVALKAQTYEKDWAVFDRLLNEGKTVSTQDWESFASKYKSQLEKYPDNTTQLYTFLGNDYSRQQQFEKAEEYYLLSLKFAQRSRDTTLKYIVNYSLGVLNYNGGDLLEAEKYYLACMVGMSAIYGQSSREYTGIFWEYTRLLIDLGKYTEAKPYVDALVYYYKTLDGENTVTYISLLNSKAIIAQNLGDYAVAIEIFSGFVAGDNLLKLGDTLSQVVQVSNLGDVYRESGNFGLAVTWLKKAKALYYSYKLDRKTAEPKDRAVLATIENNLALCYKSLSDPQKAEQAYNNALIIYRDIGEATSEPYCSTLSNKANLISDLGRRGEASELLLTAIQIRKTYFGEHSENYANALANLANVYFDEGLYKKSLEENLKANVIYKETIGENHQGYANNLNSLSLCYLQLKDYKQAEAYKIKALQIIENTVGKNHYRYASFLISTSGLYRAIKQPEKAEKNLKEALQLVEHNFGRKHELFARAQFALAEVCAVEGKFEEAAPLYFECLDYYASQLNDYFNAMSEENQMEFLQFITPIFESYNIYLINFKWSAPGKNFSDYLKRALKYQLQLKSLLANRSAQVRKEVANSQDEDLKTQYRNWQLVKNELVNNLKLPEQAVDNNSLLEKASALEIQLKSKIKTFSQLGAVSYETLRESLGPAEAAIELFKVTETRSENQTLIKYGALVIRKGSTEPAFVIFQQGGLLDSTNFEYYSKCVDGQLADTASYAAYFKPFEGYLKGITRLYISGDGIFHKISFSGLYNTSAKKYVLDDYDIIQTSNLASISNASKGKVGGLTAALFGYPDYDYDFKKQNSQPSAHTDQVVAKRFGLTQLAKLPGTKVEVEQISKELTAKNWDIAVYTEQFASEANLRKIKDPRVLHIATHGFYLKDVETNDRLFLGFERSAIQSNSMLRSGIILAGAGPATQDSTNTDSENDGILTADEATLLNLNMTDLVILSACQTGLGDEVGPEGVAGLQRSFAIAGAKNIIMSLWPVDDNATQTLMTQFYKNYALGQSADLSFKQAQLAVRKKYPAPYFWAAFVLLKTFN